MAWGIIVAGFSMFGMLVLLLANVLVEDGPEGGTSAVSYPEGEPEPADLRKAA